jgi:3-phosphoshikimate 1-carboxyvinyltransferase
LRGPAVCADALAGLRAAMALGADWWPRSGGVIVNGGAHPPSAEIDCGESGLTLRSFSALAALEQKPIRLLARGTLQRRPMRMVEEALEAMGAAVSSNGGFAPLVVNGPMRGGQVVLDGSLSSQHISGMLLACPLLPADTHLVVKSLASRPYLAMTLKLLGRFGIKIDASQELDEYFISGGQSYRCGVEVAIEGDWSGAAAFLVAGALREGITIRGLDPRSAQADRAVCQALELAGARIEWLDDGVRVQAGRLYPLTFDLRHCPDLGPPLAALAANIAGTSRLERVGRLVHKESDRLQGLMAGLGAMGARLRLEEDTLFIEGGRLREARLHCQGDHRLLMAFSAAAIGAGCPVTLVDDECVAKSYPEFFSHLALLGVDVHE